MKKLLPILFILQISFSQAQQVRLNLSDKFDFNDIRCTMRSGASLGQLFLEEYLYKIGDYFYRIDMDMSGAQFAFTAKLSKVRHAVTLYKYDSKMSVVKKNELEDGKMNFGPFHSRLISFNGKLLLFFYKYPDEETIKLSVAEVNPETLELGKINDVFTFSQANFGILGALEYNPEDNGLYAAFSPDKTKLLILHQHENKIFTCIFSGDLNMTDNMMLVATSEKNLSIVSAVIDNSANKYVSYRYVEKGLFKSGTVIENNKGETDSRSFNTGDPNYGAKNLYFKASENSSKVYLYGNFYGDQLNEGFLICEADAANTVINHPKLFPYPDDFKHIMYDLSFGDIKKGHYSVEPIAYDLLELDNGTIALVGQANQKIENATATHDMITYYSGPIAAFFINGDKTSYALIPRKMNDDGFSTGCFAIPYHNNVLCLYYDHENNVTNNTHEKRYEINNKFYQLRTDGITAFASAVIDQDGNILKKEILEEHPRDGSRYLISFRGWAADGKYIIPYGRPNINPSKDILELRGWNYLEIQ